MSDSELTEKTKVPLGLVIATIIAFISGALWINNSLNQIRTELTIINHKISGQFTARDMEIWIIRFQRENPSIKVPEFTK